MGIMGFVPVPPPPQPQSPQIVINISGPIFMGGGNEDEIVRAMQDYYKGM